MQISRSTAAVNSAVRIPLWNYSLFTNVTVTTTAKKYCMRLNSEKPLQTKTHEFTLPVLPALVTTSKSPTFRHLAQSLNLQKLNTKNIRGPTASCI